MSQTRDITYNGVTFEVEFNYSPGRSGCHTLSNGDPGYPDEPPEVEILTIKLEGNDTDLLGFFQSGRQLYDREGNKVSDAFDEITTLVYELEDLCEGNEP